MIYFEGRYKKTIQKEINYFRFPSSITRLEFDLACHQNWKAASYRNFFMYMALHLFKNKMGNKHFYNLATLIYGKIFCIFIKFLK